MDWHGHNSQKETIPWIGQFELPAANPMENHDGFIMSHPHFYPFLLAIS